MPNLLIVDDEVNICTLIKKYADYEGHTSTFAHDGRKAVELCEENTYDLIIMDVMMPIMNGFDAVDEIRKFTSTPVIMLTARGEEYDKIHGFDIGIDDYVVKPFSVKELMMRIQAILNRVNKYKNNMDVFNTLKINYLAHVVTIDDVRVDLSPKEYKLLFYLAQNKNIALTREQIIIEVWGYDYDGDDRTLDTHIKLLRKNLGPYKDCIATVRGVGYRFEETQC
ncbi:MAG: response regulator transcription factor [Erysipelotrichaceae bacterium]|nr:response regulator transcription factor [Erysipelotrichaceae bacterium]